MVTAMGGPIDLLERPEKYLSRSVSVQAVYPPRRGYVAKIDTRSLGLCVVKLGGGRREADAKIVPSVGLSAIAAIGTAGIDAPLCMIHARDQDATAAAANTIITAYKIEDEAPRRARSCIIAHIGPAEIT